MRDDDGGAAMAQQGERLLHQRLALGVERAGGLVEQQDARVAQQRAGQHHALPLAAGKAPATGADKGRKTIRKGGDEVGSGGGARGFRHLGVGGAGTAHADVGGDRVVEQQRVLADIGDGVAQAGERDFADIGAVEADGAGGGVVKARDQRQCRRFAGAGGADQRHSPAGLGDEREATQAAPAVGISEMHILELQPATPRRQRHRIARLDDAGPLVDHREHARQPRQPFLQRGVQRAERTQRLRRQHQRGDETSKIAKRAGAHGRAPAGEAERDRHRAAAQYLQPRIDAAAAAADAQQRAIEPVERRFGAQRLRGFQAVGAHRARLGKTLGQQRRGLAHAFLHAAGGAANAPADQLDRQCRDRKKCRRDQAHLPVEIQHRADQSDQLDAVAEAVDRAGKCLADGGGIGGEAGGQRRRRVALDAGEVGVHQMLEHSSL